MRAAYRRCSRTVSRTAFSALVAALLVGCGTAAAPASASPSATAASRDVPFTTVTLTGNSRQDGGGPAIIVGTTDQRSELIRSLVPTLTPPASGAMLLAVFQGEQRTGGYSIVITSIVRNGDQLAVRATFTQPAPAAVVTEVITSPAHVVSVAKADVAGAKVAVLFDDKGTERARADLP